MVPYLIQGVASVDNSRREILEYQELVGIRDKYQDGLDALKTLEVLFRDEHRELLPRDVATALVDLDESSLSLGESLHSPSQELRGPLLLS